MASHHRRMTYGGSGFRSVPSLKWPRLCLTRANPIKPCFVRDQLRQVRTQSTTTNPRPRRHALPSFYGLQSSSPLCLRTMKVAVLFRRFCLRRGAAQLAAAPPLRTFSTPPSQQLWRRQLQRWSNVGKRSRARGPVLGSVLFAVALGPGAFMELAEKTSEDETGEKQMLIASRQELHQTVSADARGYTRLRQEICVFLYSYVYEPIATGFRFLHLTVIFLPVLVSVPVVWIGRRNPDRNNQRWGTLWWFDFLVKAMERAGPAFIKVRLPKSQCYCLPC
jgi:hypothetical protein